VKQLQTQHVQVHQQLLQAVQLSGCVGTPGAHPPAALLLWLHQLLLLWLLLLVQLLLG
jgi:hypothetical protein